MNREEILATLTEHGDELRRHYGVKTLSLFGSAARNEAGKGSDVDLLVEFERPMGYFRLFHLQDFLQRMLGGAEVDLVLRQAIIDDLKDIIDGEAIHVVG